MNDPIPKVEDLSAQVDALRRQNFILLLALIVIGGTIAVYLRYQAKLAHETLTGIQPQANAIIQTYNVATANINQTNVANFVNQITAFAVTHPDFQPILKKYGWTPPANAAAPVKK